MLNLKVQERERAKPLDGHSEDLKVRNLKFLALQASEV